MNLETALQQFDIVDSNLTKLEVVWNKMRLLIPDGVSFVGESPEAREFRQLLRTYGNLLSGLPPIDGWMFKEVPLELDEIAQNRLDALEVGDFESQVSIERMIDAPGREIDEYRARMTRKRREITRARLDELASEIDECLNELVQLNPDRSKAGHIKSSTWEKVEKNTAEVDRLIGSGTRSKNWHNLRRHINFAQACDLYDIFENDWPGIKADLQQLAFDQSEPIPVEIKDLGVLTASKPKGPVSTALKWKNLDEDAFERLIFEILCTAEGYQNPEWLMKTNAPDRGRDITAYRARQDSLSGTIRERIVIQCKHWSTKSISDTDVTALLTKISHWEPPIFQVLIIATSGRFTQDAVKWIENHNHQGVRPKIEMWAESHLERLVAERSYLSATFHLR